MELSKRKKKAITKYGKNSNKLKIYDATNEHEIYGLIGLWLKLGANGFEDDPLTEIFSTKKSSGSLDAHLTFSKNRYEILISCLRFDDKDNRPRNPDNTLIDVAVHIREVDFFILTFFL